ncbi:MAG: ABC transporter ATP-binding protein [Desulfurivibrionaceae bacterium]|nr:ABC transporter ATP-binding protein [Desulfobulbales bacterium]MDT8334765.1 ABC transporter ATP-binding protein [Desulfurivibrionaceae bacterium]
MKDSGAHPIKELDCKARGITKTFVQGPTRLEVLKGIDLDLKRGEMIAIVGTSGTGKTTLLQILGGLDRPSSGSMFFNDEDIFRKADRELSKFRNRAIGFVFQFHHLLPEFTALENVMMPGLIGGEDREPLIERALNLLDQVGLAARSAHKIGELSGGEQQRVALARALIMQPDLLLADEPTGNLDPATGARVFELIRKMNRELGLTTVMVTHNHALAKRMDRCLALRDGILRDAALTIS